MKFIELNNDYFVKQETSQEVLSMDFNEYFDVEEREGANYLILDCRKVTDEEVVKLVDGIRTRYIVYGHATDKQKIALDEWGHFDMSHIWEEENFPNLLEYMFEDWDKHQGWSSPDESLRPTDDLMEHAKYFERHGQHEITVEGNFPKETLAFRYEITSNWEPLLIGGIFRRIGRTSSAGKRLLTLDYDTTGTLEVMFKFSQIDDQGNIIKQDIVKEKEFIFDFSPSHLSVQIFLSGKGKLRLGKIWIYKYKHEMGYFNVGDERFITKENEFIHSYYIPGKVQTHLLVGFTGALNNIPHYERQSMAGVGFPVLLFNDSRERSGVGQLGRGLSKQYEKDLMSVIDKKLDELNLTRKDLIFTGWSLGSYPALYYGLKMGASHIIPCKSLVNMGNMTENLDVIYDSDATFMNIRQYTMGRADKADTDRLNQLMRDTADQADLSYVTIYAFLMMYDGLDLAKPFLETLRPRVKRMVYEEYPDGHGGRAGETSRFIWNTLVNIRDGVEGGESNE